ncbi:GntR family transcriptional regulator [Streptomyces albidoflavus]
MAGEQASGSGKTTRSEAVHARLREEIYAGALRPGARLRLVELSQRFAVSQSVIREALTRLCGQGLVRATPQRGFRVVTISPEDLTELTEARIEIETLVLRRAVERGDLRWEAEVVAAHHHLAGVTGVRPDGTVDPEWFAVHEHFHRTLLQGCGNTRLLATALTLREAATLYRRWSVPVGQDTGRDVVGEHQRLTDAVLARDADTATALLAAHLTRTTQALLTAIDRDPGALDPA